VTEILYRKVTGRITFSEGEDTKTMDKEELEMRKLLAETLHDFMGEGNPLEDDYFSWTSVDGLRSVAIVGVYYAPLANIYTLEVQLTEAGGVTRCVNPFPFMRFYPVEKDQAADTLKCWLLGSESNEEVLRAWF
jgi:hypothetical protein